MDKKVLRSRLWQVIRPNFGSVSLLLLFNIASACFGVTFALASRRVLDIATGEIEGDLLLASGALIGLLILQVTVDFGAMYVSDIVSTRLNKRIKETVFMALFRKRWKDVSRYHTGELMSRLTGDATVVVNAISSALPRTVSFVVQMVACIGVLFSLEWRFTLILLVVATTFLFLYRLLGRRMKKLHIKCREAEGQSLSYMQEATSNWMVIRSFDGNQTVGRRLGNLLKMQFRLALRRARVSHVASVSLRVVFSGGYYLALAWGAVQISLGYITYGTLMAFLQIVSQLRAPMVNMSGVGVQYFNMMASAERLFELTELEDEPEPTLPARELYDTLEEIRLQDVCFGYDADHPVLRHASVTMRRGEFVALSGFSGIGKSTMFKLLLGFYTPDSGTIEAVTSNGVVPLGAQTRGLFAYVPQQNMLLSGTVRENITFFCDDVSDEELWRAVEIADIADAIREMPQGMDTVLGERGAGMSEGQLQRLAIARAIVGGAPILLLDESTSALDEPTEARVLKNLRELSDRTCICISHRPAALEMCDHIIHISENGEFQMD